MNRAKFTPGPWIYQHSINSDMAFKILTEHQSKLGGTVLALVPYVPAQADGTALDNARLLAAAPALVEALDDLVAFTKHVFKCRNIQFNDFCATTSAETLLEYVNVGGAYSSIEGHESSLRRMKQ
jgi:hypothetical protein